MTRIPVHTVDSAPEGSHDGLKTLEAQFDKVLQTRRPHRRAGDEHRTELGVDRPLRHRLHAGSLSPRLHARQTAKPAELQSPLANAITRAV
jgi:hypothetical protein